MTDNDPPPPFEGAERFTRLWFDFAGNMAKAGMSSAGDTPPDAARQMRDAFFKTLTEYCDDYMRSPEFLEGMRDSVNRSIELRKELNEFLGRIHHEFQGTSRQDVDHIMQAIKHMERRMIDSVERIDSRLDDLESKLNGSLPAGGAKPASKAASRTAGAGTKASPKPAAKKKSRKRAKP